MAPGKFHNYNLTRLPKLLQIKGAPECLINTTSNSPLIFFFFSRKQHSLLLQKVATGASGLTPSVCCGSYWDLETCNAFLVPTPGRERGRGGRGYLGEKSSFYDIIRSSTNCYTNEIVFLVWKGQLLAWLGAHLKTFPNLVKLLLSFQIFIAAQLTGPPFFTFHSFSLYWWLMEDVEW